ERLPGHESLWSGSPGGSNVDALFPTVSEDPDLNWQVAKPAPRSSKPQDTSSDDPEPGLGGTTRKDPDESYRDPRLASGSFRLRCNLRSSGWSSPAPSRPLPVRSSCKLQLAAELHRRVGRISRSSVGPPSRPFLSPQLSYL